MPGRAWCADRAGCRASPSGTRSRTAASRGCAFAGEVDEGLLEVGAPARGEQLGRRALRHDRTLADDHDRVAQRRDLLHDVAGEKDALARVAEPAHHLAEITRRHDIEA